jgi:ribonuclease Z
MSRGLSVLRLTFLGTSAAAPTATRNVSGLALKADSDLFLFDCGEGSQRQMIRFGTGFKLRGIFFTHFHADHYLGVIGLLRTLGMLGREEVLHLYGPPPGADLLDRAIHLGVERLGFPVEIHEIEDGFTLKEGAYEIRGVRTNHGLDSRCYVFREEARPGSFDVEKARTLGLTPGPDFRRLQDGETVGSVKPSDVLGPPQPGRHIVISGDTRPCEATASAARDADLLVHEATFSDAEQERAIETRHSTAREAASIARLAGARRLVLTHLSARFEDSHQVLLSEARSAYEGPLEVAWDGLTIDVPLRHPGSGDSQ